ncbi:MAG: acetyl-CoA decarbonylase/synthase complex subunit alpha/beta [Planctomycetota bacterium]|jgi:acetyl-CoA synthase
MSKLIASAAIRGAHKIVNRAEEAFKKAKEEHGPDKPVEFPNTAYFLPVVYGNTGIEVRTVGDLEQVVQRSKSLLPPVPEKNVWVPYLGHTLDAGMATLFADEVIEIVKYLQDPLPYVVAENCPDEGNFWLGAADDVIMRKRGIEFVDGSAPGFAACVGACPTSQIAKDIALELQEKNLYIFLAGDTNGVTMSDQLREEGVQLGWETRLVPFGRDITSAIYALGFATRAAMSFGGVQPGDFTRILKYNKNRIFAFVLAFGEIDDEKYAQAAGAINYGFPAIADTPIPEILPTGVCTYEHVVAPVPHRDIVQKAIEVRGLKVQITKVPIPVPYGPAFEGERIRKDDMCCQMGGNKSPAFEFVQMKDMSEVTDGKVDVIGQDIGDVKPGSAIPLGIVAEVAGREMQADFEPILERWIHTFINEAHGIFHMGQRDINWIRVSNEAKDAGVTFADFGKILHAKFHSDFGKISDKVQVKVYTNEEDVIREREIARATYRARDERLGKMTDEETDTFYSCTLCQSFAPNHVCVITPERTGLCGAYNWFDGKAAFKIDPTGPNQPVKKGDVIDPVKGQWAAINEFVHEKSRKALERFNAYSIMEDPMTSCGCFECIAAILPLTNGIMTVNREFAEMTPCGMKFSTLAGTVGGGQQIPGFVGHSKSYIGSKKFILAEGGLKRLVWMPTMLKEEIKHLLEKRGDELGIANLMDLIADETTAQTEEEVAAFLEKVGHPVLELDPLM